MTIILASHELCRFEGPACRVSGRIWPTIVCSITSTAFNSDSCLNETSSLYSCTQLAESNWEGVVCPKSSSACVLVFQINKMCKASLTAYTDLFDSFDSLHSSYTLNTLWEGYRMISCMWRRQVKDFSVPRCLSEGLKRGEWEAWMDNWDSRWSLKWSRRDALFHSRLEDLRTRPSALSVRAR